jgi:hypothetical protein
MSSASPFSLFVLLLFPRPTKSMKRENHIVDPTHHCQDDPKIIYFNKLKNMYKSKCNVSMIQLWNLGSTLLHIANDNEWWKKIGFEKIKFHFEWKYWMTLHATWIEFEWIQIQLNKKHDQICVLHKWWWYQGS